MNTKTKKIIAKFARGKKNKLELLMEFPTATKKETKQINLFYEISKEIIKLKEKGVDEKKLKQIITKMGYGEKDLEIMLGKNNLEKKTKFVLINLISLVIILLFFSFFGNLFYGIMIQTNWDFLKKDFVVKGNFFLEDTNFWDTKITSNGIIKNVLVTEKNYHLSIRCNEKQVLSFFKKGFIPIYKKIECEEQEMDLVFLRVNKPIKLNQEETTKIINEGVRIEINEKDLIETNTNNNAKNSYLFLNSFKLNGVNELNYFPGELRGTKKSGEMFFFKPNEFVYLMTENENGEKLNLKKNSFAKIFFLINEKQNQNLEETILLFFDEEKKIWVKEEQPKKICEKNECFFEGKINKLNSFWCIAQPLNEKQITIKKIESNTMNKNFFNEKKEYKIIYKNQHLFEEKQILFKDFNKETNLFLPNNIEELFISINNIPLTKINFTQTINQNNLINSIQLNYSDFSLNNCEYWNENEPKIFSCITNYDALFGTNFSEAKKLVQELKINEESKNILLIKLIKYFGETKECYSLINSSPFFGVECIKIMDKEKKIDSNKNISLILSQKMSEEKKSCSLTKLAKYYYDENYCEKITLINEKEKCVNFFPKKPEYVSPPNLCGNGLIDEGEECDGNNFLGKTCSDFGFNKGELFCVNCKINKSGCYNEYN